MSASRLAVVCGVRRHKVSSQTIVHIFLVLAPKRAHFVCVCFLYGIVRVGKVNDLRYIQSMQMQKSEHFCNLAFTH